MIFYALSLALSVVVVVTTKGSFQRLGAVAFKNLWLLFIGLAIQIVVEFVAFPQDRIDDAGFAILILSYAAILAFCAVNRAIKGMTIITLGVVLNVLVIALNQGMPTKDDVRERDGREVRVPIEQTVKHRPQDNDTLFPFLGDVITLPRFPNQQFSVGDIVIALGIVDLCFEGSRVPRRRGVKLPAESAQQS